jgi:uncharacterized SAM-binding protein YcdF (DUF218 family)
MRSRINVRTRWRRWLVGTILVILVLGAVVFWALVLVIVRYGQTDHARPADVLIVLGGGEVGTTRRTEHAAVLYHQGYAPVLICAGSAFEGQPISEAERCAAVARAHGVPSGAILLDENSRSTEENAIETARIMRAHGWQTAVIVSDNYHLWRAHWLFESEGITAWTSPAQITVGPLKRQEQVFSILREIAATGWYVGKSLLGLLHTRVGE